MIRHTFSLIPQFVPQSRVEIIISLVIALLTLLVFAL